MLKLDIILVFNNIVHDKIEINRFYNNTIKFVVKQCDNYKVC